jgi:hypothetical protein
MSRIIALGLLVAAITGCATSPVAQFDAKPAPESQVMGFKTNAPGSGAVSITRDSGHTGSMCAVGVFVDGRVAALLHPSERVTLYIPAGQVVIGAAYQGSGICGMGADRQERDITVTAGAAKKYRISTSAGGVLDVLPSTL